MVIEFLLFLAIGKLLIWAIQSQSLTQYVISLIGRWHPIKSFLQDLVGCQFCTGFWVYLVLSIGLGIDLLGVLGMSSGNYWLARIITATTSSFVVFIFSRGWIVQFGVEVID